MFRKLTENLSTQNNKLWRNFRLQLYTWSQQFSSCTYLTGLTRKTTRWELRPRLSVSDSSEGFVRSVVRKEFARPVNQRQTALLINGIWKEFARLFQSSTVSSLKFGHNSFGFYSQVLFKRTSCCFWHFWVFKNVFTARVLVETVVRCHTGPIS